MEFVVSGVYKTKENKLIIIMGDVPHAVKIKNEFLHQYTSKGEAEHTETGEIIQLFEHSDTKVVVGVTRGLTKLVKSDILTIYQDLETKKLFACPKRIFMQLEMVRVDE